MMKAYNAKLPLMAGAGLALLALGGCSDFKQAIGTEKSTPDEFEVVVRPPLSLPPGFSSRPTANSVAQETVVTTATISATSQTSRLLEVRRDTIDGYDDLFAFDSVPADIRNLVDEETAGILFERRLPFQIVFGGLPNVGPVLDQMEEDMRLRKNRLDGKLPTQGATKAVDGVDGTTILLD